MLESLIDNLLILYRKLHEVLCKIRIFRIKPKPINGKIFLYHGITDKKDFFKHLNVNKFERHIRFLTENYMPVHLDELIKMDKSEKRRSFAITFDDGYESIYSLAFPILKKYNVPFTFFIITDTLEKDEFIWNDRFDSAVRGINEKYIKLTFEDQEFKMKISGNYRLGLKLSILKNKLKFLSYKEINDYIRGIENKYSPNIIFSETDKVITLKKVREMLDSGLCKIGSHTCNHVSLTSVPIDEAENQVKSSLSWIQKEIGTENLFFCYPHGHFNDEVRSIVKKYGYIGAVTTVKGDNILMDDVFSINRNPVNMEDLNRFRIIHNL